MREISFRGKRVDNGEWVYGSYLHDELSCIDNHYIVEETKYVVNPETLGQYTGYKDFTGKKIYEGDIVKLNIVIDGAAFHCHGFIVFSEGSWKNIFHTPKQNYFDDLYCCNKCVSVIGNIHDNIEFNYPPQSEHS